MMKKIYAHNLLFLFILLISNTIFSQNDNNPTKLGNDIMFTIFEGTGGGPKIVLLLQKKDGTEVTIEEFHNFSYQEKPGIPEGFKELDVKPGNYKFDNFFQRGEFEFHGRYSKGRFTLYFHPITVMLDVKDGEIESKSWYEYSDTDLKIECEKYYDNGKISEKGFIKEDGSKTGEWKNYDKDGILIMSGEYENDERIGVWKSYNSKGEVTSEINIDKKSEGNAFEKLSK